MHFSKITKLFEMSDASSVGECRRYVGELVKDCGFDETEQGQIAIVVNELANNLLKHAVRGSFLVRTLQLGNAFGIELLTIDRGPGIQSVAEAMRDGFSTAGSPGTGLGAIKRLAAVFDIYTQVGKGSIFLAQFRTKAFAEKWVADTSRLESGVVCFPIKGEKVCGDSWAHEVSEGRNYLAVFDGLGHGILAAEASTDAIVVFEKNLQKKPCELLLLAHESLRKTRGAAGALAELNEKKSNVNFAGIGNIAGAVLPSDFNIKRMASHNGTLGLNLTRVHDFDYVWNQESTLILASDGLTTHWKFETYPGIQSKHPSIVAALMFRDYSRNTDDTTVLVAKERSQVSCL